MQGQELSSITHTAGLPPAKMAQMMGLPLRRRQTNLAHALHPLSLTTGAKK